jgi:hypothetical protein
MSSPGWRGVLCVAALAGWAYAGRAAAQDERRDDPYAYDLRIGVFPAAFQGGISQSSFGSGLRAELDLSRRFTLSVAGRLPWLPVAGQTDSRGFSLRAGLAWNFEDEVQVERLGGSVYPEDTPVVSERGGVEFETPVHQKLGGPRLAPPDVDRDVRAALRNVHSLRLGADFMRAVERARPAAADGRRYFENTLLALHLGYSWGTHWNLSPATAGVREVGFRRFFVDVLLTVEDVASAELVSDTDTLPLEFDSSEFLPVGVRLGMEGSIAGMLRRTPGLGFGYSLELGMLPGRSGLEGYLFAGLGLELDFMLH